MTNHHGSDKPQWELTVSDTGPGIPPHLLQRLDPQYAVNTPELNNEGQLRNTEIHGEGIGLFIVKRLCELIGVQMKVKSDSSSGTRFYLTFPQALMAADN